MKNSQHRIFATLDFSQHKNRTRSTNFSQHLALSHNIKFLPPLNIKIELAILFLTFKNILQHSTSATLKSNPQHKIFTTSNISKLSQHWEPLEIKVQLESLSFLNRLNVVCEAKQNGRKF